MRKINLIIILTLFGSIAANAYAGTVTISSPIPSPSGNYDRLRLVPRTPVTGTCENGTLYVPNNKNVIYFCKDNTYVPLTSPWDQTQGYVHLVDDLNKVGIGTIAPEFKLSLDNDGGILAKGTYQSGASLIASGFGTRLIWYPRKAAFRAGKVSGDQWDNGNIGDFSTAFGYNTKVQSIYSSILGGQGSVILPNLAGSAVIGGGTNNTIYDGGSNAVIGGGANNQIGTLGNSISGNTATIGGGSGNIARGVGSTIAGGISNEAGDPANFWLDFSSFVGAGRANKAYAIDSVVTGGALNTIEKGAPASVISGGSSNFIQGAGDKNTISGGHNNRIDGWRSAIAGGTNNLVTTTDPVNTPVANAFIGGGDNNRAWGNASTISGGMNNIAGVFTDPAIHSTTVGGGTNNQATGVASTVGGGANNQATSQTATVSGGNLNQATGNSSTVGGGAENFATAQASTVAGGNQNRAEGINSTIAGGYQNLITGNGATILGGAGNNTAGDTSLVAGYNMILGADADNTFIWGHAGSPIPAVSTSNAFIIYSGNVGIGTITPNQKLQVAGAVRLEPQNNPPICADDTLGTLYVYVDGGLCFCNPDNTWEQLNSKGSCP